MIPYSAFCTPASSRFPSMSTNKAAEEYVAGGYYNADDDSLFHILSPQSRATQDSISDIAVLYPTEKALFLSEIISSAISDSASVPSSKLLS